MTASSMTCVSVETSKKYDVCIGSGLLKQAGSMIMQTCKGRNALLVCDDIVQSLYADVVEASLNGAGYDVKRFIFKNGEASKTMDTFSAILQDLATSAFTRSDIVVALGGGVTGDMAGFAASVYLRGIKFAQIPTTLLAMVDSSVGGKTAIDLPVGKNLVGSFYQPDIVICDVDTLKTLPDDIFSDGCAEVIKHGVILSDDLFEMLSAPLSSGDARMVDIIARNVTIKRDIVIKDERESGLRKLLNFGHTIGHGIEKLSGYKVSHGSAVAAGMAIETRCAMRAGLCGADTYSEITDMLEQYGLTIETDFTAQELIDVAFFDKKRSGTSITMIIPERIGASTLRDFSISGFSEYIKAGAEA